MSWTMDVTIHSRVSTIRWWLVVRGASSTCAAKINQRTHLRVQEVPIVRIESRETEEWGMLT